MRPFKRDIYHGFKWRGWWDFGTGALGDIGCHSIDWPWWALKLTAPTSVEASCYGAKPETGPLWSNVTYQFPANGDRSAIKLCWYDGRNRNTPKNANEWKALATLHDLAELGDRGIPEGGQLYIGDKGKILVIGDSPRLVPESRMKDFKRPDKVLPRNPLGHHGEWLAACQGGKPAGSNFAYAGPLAEAVLLGNVALRLGKKISWDSPNLKATNAPEADALIRRQYRKGWDI
jgi:predicted dehydrogenase